LHKIFHQYRTDGFENIKKIAKQIAEQLEVDPVFVQHRSRRKKTFFSYEGTDASSYNPKEIFTRDVFFPLVDTILSTIKNRFEQLKIHNNMWNFLYNIKKLPKCEDLLKHCMHLQENLKVEESTDINGLELCEELLHFQYLVNQNPVSPIGVLRIISDKKLQDIFHNIRIYMHFMLTIPVGVASSERSFSKFKLVKTYMWSTMAQEKLSSIAVLSTENSVAQNLDFYDIISSFAEIKAMKINILSK
jgi:hypothetical protein